MRQNLRFPDGQIPIKTINGVAPDENGELSMSIQAPSENLSNRAFRHPFTSSDIKNGTLTIEKMGIPV